jgi:copper transport protein
LWGAAQSQFFFCVAHIVRTIFYKSWFILALLAAWPPGVAHAHASLVRSQPDNGAILVQAPVSVRFEFSEPVDPGFFQARLVDSSGRVVVAGPGALDPAEPEILLLELPALPDGAYTALWQVRSAVDGHITSGGVAFAAGSQAALVSILPPPGAARPTTQVPPLAGALLRWLNFAAAILLSGPLLFGLLVWRPAFRTWDSPTVEADEQARRIFRQLAWVGLAGSIVGGFGLLLFQAWQASAGKAGSGFLDALGVLLSGRAGLLLYARLGLVGLVAWVLFRAGRSAQARWSEWGLGAICGLGALLTISLYSHSAALGEPVPLLVDWIHLAALAAWTGGLLPLLLVLRQGEMPPSLLVPRFSRLALLAVAALSTTGLYLAYRQVGSVEALAATLYGWALGAKVALGVGLLALGAANLLVFSPRLEGTLGSAAHRLRGSLRLELALAALALLAAALMASSAPAREALEAERRAGYIDSFVQGDIRLDLWVAPRRPGFNEVAVDLSGPPDRLESEDLEVLLNFEMLDHEMGITQVAAAPNAAVPEGDLRRYSVSGGHLSMAGRWRVEAILRQPGVDDVRHDFEVLVEAPAEGTFRENPVAASEGSTAAGRARYTQYCVSCHGVAGKGDGPVARTMNPPPADLTQHGLPGVHPDGQLFEWIANGYPGSQMPAFAEILSEEDHWHLVNYLRAMSLGNP